MYCGFLGDIKLASCQEDRFLYIPNFVEVNRTIRQHCESRPIVHIVTDAVLQKMSGFFSGPKTGAETRRAAACKQGWKHMEKYQISERYNVSLRAHDKHINTHTHVYIYIYT